MDEYQQQLFEKIKQIDDADILNLLVDGAVQRSLRDNREIIPQAYAATERFADEVEELFEAAKRAEKCGEESDEDG